VAESVGENQPVWLDSLKEDLAKMKSALNIVEYISAIFWTDDSRGKEASEMIDLFLYGLFE
jgi:hypothetical protein